MRAIALFFALALPAAPALGQDRIPSHCIALAQGPATAGPEMLYRASFREPVALDTVRLTYVDHAMFLIQTPTIAAVTDFAGFLGNTTFTPDVVTMNNAHSTHWTAFPDPAIPHVLQGWATGDTAADHDLDLGEMLVRNIPTDIRSGMGVRTNGNSIFVFEAAGLCIGHLGHLHHEPTPEDYAMLGRVDVVMAPVDGGLTLDQPTLLRVLDRLRARVVIPMHWFGTPNLESFLVGMDDTFDIDRRTDSTLTLSLQTLPDRPTVVVLAPALLSD